MATSWFQVWVTDGGRPHKPKNPFSSHISSFLLLLTLYLSNSLNFMSPPTRGRTPIKGHVDHSLRKTESVFPWRSDSLPPSLSPCLLIFGWNEKAALRSLLFGYSLECRKCAGRHRGYRETQNTLDTQTEKQEMGALSSTGAFTQRLETHVWSRAEMSFYNNVEVWR